MSDYGILFSAPMIRALLRPVDPKTVTRRMSERWLKVKTGDRLWVRETWRSRPSLDKWSAKEIVARATAAGFNPGCPVRYEADYEERSWGDDDEGDFGCNWGRIRQSIFMPRCASRITLEATEDARREPLHAITREDCLAEGILYNPPVTVQNSSVPALYSHGTTDGYPTAKDAYRALWDELHGKDDPWSSNPTVIRLAFRRVPA